MKFNHLENLSFKSVWLWKNLILLFLTVLIWLIFYPGLMSPDSVGQYGQAVLNSFNDWHPPIMAAFVWVTLKFGGGIGILIFFQCLFAIFGIQKVMHFLILFFSQNRISKDRSNLAATILTLFFLLPFLSPFMFYTVIFWKDAWLAITFLWLTSYLLWLFLNFEQLDNSKFIIHLLLFSLVCGFTILTRHNALVVLPIVSLFLAIISYNRFGKSGLVTLVLPLLFWFCLNSFIFWFFGVGQTYATDQVMASDLVTMLKLYPELKSKYPLANRHFNAPIMFISKEAGLVVWDESTVGKPCPYMKCNQAMVEECFGDSTNTENIDGLNCYMYVGKKNKALENEYIQAFKSNPFNLLIAKLYLFGQMFPPENWQTIQFTCDIYENQFGLKPNEYFSKTRLSLCNLSSNIGSKWYFRWVSGLHAVWLFLNILGVVYSVGRLWVKKDLKSVVLLFILLIPMSYYFSYVIAAITSDYRYMYPSTLIMQTIFFSYIAARLLLYFHKEDNTANLPK